MSRHHKNRIREIAPAAFFSQGQGLSREQAIGRIRLLLERDPRHAEALYLTGLFNIAPEELTEAGLPYEVLRSLEKTSLGF